MSTTGGPGKASPKGEFYPLRPENLRSGALLLSNKSVIPAKKKK